MSEPPSTFRDTPGSTFGDTPRAQAEVVARQVSLRWDEGSVPDLPAAVLAHPCLAQDRSILLDLAQKEYRLRHDEWRTRSPDEYCDRFTGLPRDFLTTLHKLIEVEQCLGDFDLPDLLRLADDADWPSEGDHFDEFELVQELGRGALARVFLARQSKLGDREVVVKLTRSATNEANVLGSLRHPNVVLVHTVGVDANTGLGWICMPYLGRRTLEHEIRDAERRGDFASPLLPAGRLDRGKPAGLLRSVEQQRTRLGQFARLADGLACVHEKGLLHGDLKPSNILLTDEGVPMLIDFNLAQQLDAESRLAGGTLPYMAPEQLVGIASKDEGPGCRPTVATEVFSFGVVLYQALTSKRPFDWSGDLTDLADAAKKILAAQREWHAKADSTTVFEPRLERLIRGCLANEPENRPQAMRLICEELEALLAPPAGWAPPISRRVLLSTGLVTAVAAVAGVAGASDWWQAVRVRQAIALAGAEQYARAIELLTAVVEANPDHLEAQRLLGDCMLESGDPAGASDVFVEAWRRHHEPIDIAMSGYCNNRIGNQEVAIYAYRTARESGYSSPAIDHNEAAGLVEMLSKDYDRDASERAQALLLSVMKELPESETTRITVLQHYFLAARVTDRPLPAYPVELVARLADSRPSVEFCTHAVRFVASAAKEPAELEEYGMPWVRRLAAYFGASSLRDVIGSPTYRKFSSLIAAEPLDAIAPEKAPPTPPLYLVPASKK